MAHGLYHCGVISGGSGGGVPSRPLKIPGRTVRDTFPVLKISLSPSPRRAASAGPTHGLNNWRGSGGE